MTFPSIDAAMEYLKSKLQDFYNQSRVLRDRLLQIGALMKEAQKKNDQQALGQLILLQQQTKDSFTDQLDLEQKLMPFANYFNVNTTLSLGIFPIVLAIAAVGVASLLYLHFEKLQNQKQALDLVAKGLLTPEQYNQSVQAGSFLGVGGLSGITGNLSTIVIVGLLAYGLFLFGPTLASKFK